MVAAFLARLPAPSRRSAIFALPLLVIAVALTVAASGDAVLPGDVAVAREVQQGEVPRSRQLAAVGYVLGATPFVTAVGIVLSIVLARAGRRSDVMFLAAILIVRGSNWLLKAVAESPRPDASQVHVAENASGLGFPSSHVISAVLLYGAVMVLLLRMVRSDVVRCAVVGAATAAMAVTGYGRVYTGAHWPSDVLGGYLWGALFLLVVVGCYRAADQRASRPLPLRVPVAIRRA